MQHHLAASGGSHLARFDDDDAFVPSLDRFKYLLLHGQWLEGHRLLAVFVLHGVELGKGAGVSQQAHDLADVCPWHPSRDEGHLQPCASCTSQWAKDNGVSLRFFLLMNSMRPAGSGTAGGSSGTTLGRTM